MTLLAIALLVLPGCQLTSDALRDGGRDDVRYQWGWRGQPGKSAGIVGRNGSVAFRVSVLWNPAIAPARWYERYYVLTSEEVKATTRQRGSTTRTSSGRPCVALRVFPAKMCFPDLPLPGRFLPRGTGSPTCFPSDLPEAFVGGAEIALAPGGDDWETRWVFVLGGKTACVMVDGEPYLLWTNHAYAPNDGYPDRPEARAVYSFRTPVGHAWRACLVPIAMVGDVLYTPIYITYFFFGAN